MGLVCILYFKKEKNAEELPSAFESGCEFSYSFSLKGRTSSLKITPLVLQISREFTYTCVLVGGITVGNLTTGVAVCFPVYCTNTRICCVERLSTLREKHFFGELL